MTKRFVHTISTYVEDTDYGGVIYHANYLKYMERARTEWLNHLQHPYKSITETGHHLVIRHVDINYLKPLHLNSIIDVSCHIAEHRRTSIVFHHDIYDHGAPQMLCASADIKLVYVDHSMKPKPLPHQLLEILL